MRKTVKVSRQIILSMTKMIAAFPVGIHRSFLTGSGGEFKTARLWQPGDRRPAMAASARTGEPMFRVFEEAKAITVWLVVDHSSSMTFGSNQIKSDAIQSICLALGFSVDNGGDRLGALTFGNKNRLVLEPGPGRSTSLQIIDDIMSEDAVDKDNLLEVLDVLVCKRPTNSLVILLSDFCFDFNRAIQNALLTILTLPRNALLSVVLRDENEEQFSRPRFTADFQDGEGVEMSAIDCRHLPSETLSRADQIKSFLQSAGSEVLFLNTSGNYMKDFAKFFLAKASNV